MKPSVSFGTKSDLAMMLTQVSAALVSGVETEFLGPEIAVHFQAFQDCFVSPRTFFGINFTSCMLELPSGNLTVCY